MALCTLQLLVFVVVCVCCFGKEKVYVNQWAVHLEGGEEVAKSVAEEHGFRYDREIMRDHYLFTHPHVHKRSTDASSHVHEELTQHPAVKWLEQQSLKKRVKREYSKLKKVSFNDPEFHSMWYLNRGHCQDMNVERSWAKGFTGKGIVVTIMDDGIEKNHPDLSKNYDPRASYDINDHDSDPQPRYDVFNFNRHGTRCAGEVAASGNNKICNVGVAYNARIGGIRMLDGDITDAVEANSISYSQNYIDIYSASWGPDDDGRTTDEPGPLAKKAFYNGITRGRHGKGNIFVWASGNGGRQGDSCSCDGYANSIYTLSVSSTTERGTVPWYSEPCASTLATTYSSGTGSDRMIITTDLRQKCTEKHTGTSASAPLAAGILALVLEANPSLTWRDIQHIVVRTARPAGLAANDWVTNGAGLKVSHSYGFGLMDTSAMVDMAQGWEQVPHQRKCEPHHQFTAKSIPRNGKIVEEQYVTGCHGSGSEIGYLEHVQIIVSLDTNRRGAIEIHLTSPQGTRCTLLPFRDRDYKPKNLKDWAFMTTHSWGEQPAGTWRLEVASRTSSAVLKKWQLVFYGTQTLPGPGPYSGKSDNCDPDVHTSKIRSPTTASIPLKTPSSSNISSTPASPSSNTSTTAQTVIPTWRPCLDGVTVNCDPNLICKGADLMCTCVEGYVFDSNTNMCKSGITMTTKPQPNSSDLNMEPLSASEVPAPPHKPVSNDIYPDGKSVIVISNVKTVFLISVTVVVIFLILIVSLIVFVCKYYQYKGKHGAKYKPLVESNEF